MYYANQQNVNYRMTVTKNLKNEKLFNIFNLNEKFYSSLKHEFNFAYAYSNILFHEIINLYGEDIILKIILNIKDGESFESAFYLSTLNSLEFATHIKLNIKIKKNIPTQAGLGSASTNAAGLIKGLINLGIVDKKDNKDNKELLFVCRSNQR